MAYVRRRTTKTGAVSTALVESFRDTEGRPRQRLLANLHGAEDALHALARLAAQRERLRKERSGLEPGIEPYRRVYATVMLNTLHGHVYSPAQRKELDRGLKYRKRLLKRIAEIDSRLAAIQKDGSVIRKHCLATDAEIRAEAQRYGRALDEAEAFALGQKYVISQMNAEFRRRQASR